MWKNITTFIKENFGIKSIKSTNVSQTISKSVIIRAKKKNSDKAVK